jgi:hypothetical protein
MLAHLRIRICWATVQVRRAEAEPVDSDLGHSRADVNDV